MREKVLYQIAKLPSELKNYLEHFFQPKSHVFLNTCKIITIRPNERFISTGEDLDKIWICISGTVKVMEEFESGETYIFTQFSAPEIFGEMEALAQISKYRASLVTVTESVFIIGSVKEYIQWLKEDVDILYERTQYLLKRVMDEGRNNRAYLLLSGMERIKLYIIERCSHCQREEVCVIQRTRQQIADETGYSVKTVNRVIKKLNEQKLLTVKGQRILVTKQQYERLVEGIDEKVKYEK